MSFIDKNKLYVSTLIVFILLLTPIGSIVEASKVVIDPGHGGEDPGASNNGVSEADIVLDISHKLNTYLTNNYDLETLMTRTDDSTVSLDERTDLANDWNADLFVSIHGNSFDDSSASGYEDYVYPGVESGATGEMRQVLHDKISEVLNQYGISDRGEKTEDFHVLRETDMSSILIEVGFITNDAELEKLTNDDFQNDFAKAVGDGIAEYLQSKD